ncbi:uncharacterized protein LOC116117440 [Pistacia vera]|uniref:uncharacterized protein LOC116117440 n=1 Tax=Pistacia vera TaxID=55513 RepID=UPI00126360B6|nr:uncharacterized protein LOC116117440 [Pistacia vera]
MVNGKSNSVALLVPIFTGEKYHFWSIKMKTYFLSQNLWKIVNEGPENTSTLSEFELQQQQQNDAAALFILQQALDDYIFSRISEAKTAKDAWQILKAEFQGNSETLPLPEQDIKNCKKYLPLYNAILEGDLLSVQQLCDEDKDALEARITVNWDTALHVAVGTANANHIVEYLVNKMSMDQVSLKNKEGNTVLSVAAMAGNLQAANMIMRKDEHQSLIEVENNFDGIPLIEAARHGQKKMTESLMQFSKSYLEYATATRFEDNSGGYLLSLLIIAGFYDLALELLRRHKRLGIYVGESLLTEITRKPSAFPSGRRRNIKLRQYVNVSKELGVCEIVKEIIKSFPDAIWFTNEKKHNIFHLTIINRQEKVFNLIFKISSHKHLLLMSRDVYGNNVLHFVGLLAPENQLNLIPGAALQMQHELQWFKEIENIVQPAYKVDKNFNGETPAMIFTEAHRELVKEGRDWMKVVANSCSLAAALIATIVSEC